MNNLLLKWGFYMMGICISGAYAFLRYKTEWLWMLPWFALCFILYDWATLKTKFVLTRTSENE